MFVRFAWLFCLVACGNNLTSTNQNKDGELIDETDDVAPVLTHDPIEETMPFGEDVAITATAIDDDSGILFVNLHYKNETGGSADWQEVIMLATGDEYSGTIRGDRMQGGGIYYYLEAIDKATNVSFAPDEGPDDPFHFGLAD